MSESYPDLSWAKVLIPPLNWLLLPTAIAFPVAVYISSGRDQVRPPRRTFGVMLSVVLSMASFLAVIPLCC